MFWPLHQFDMNNAFLHETLDEDVYFIELFSVAEIFIMCHGYLPIEILRSLCETLDSWNEDKMVEKSNIQKIFY